MSDVVDRIIEVLRRHYVFWDEYIDAGDRRVRCRCDVDDPHITNSVPDGGWMPFGEWTAHVAERVAAELKLAEETAFRYTHLASGRYTIIESTSSDVRIARKIAGDTHELSKVSRWVSDWSEEKP